MQTRLVGSVQIVHEKGRVISATDLQTGVCHIRWAEKFLKEEWKRQRREDDVAAVAELLDEVQPLFWKSRARGKFTHLKNGNIRRYLGRNIEWHKARGLAGRRRIEAALRTRLPQGDDYLIETFVLLMDDLTPPPSGDGWKLIRQ